MYEFQSTESLPVELLILKSLLWAANGFPEIPSKDFQACEIKAGSSVDCAVFTQALHDSDCV